MPGPSSSTTIRTVSGAVAAPTRTRPPAPAASRAFFTRFQTIDRRSPGRTDARSSSPIRETRETFEALATAVKFSTSSLMRGAASNAMGASESCRCMALREDCTAPSVSSAVRSMRRRESATNAGLDAGWRAIAAKLASAVIPLAISWLMVARVWISRASRSPSGTNATRRPVSCW